MMQIDQITSLPVNTCCTEYLFITRDFQESKNDQVAVQEILKQIIQQHAQAKKG